MTAIAIADAVTRLAREEGGRILALLAARFGLDAADDAVQDALIEALGWQSVPDNPAAWLYIVARNRAIDHLRREAAARRRAADVAADLAVLRPVAADPLALGGPEEEETMIIGTDRPVGDEQLRLILLCCHPALAVPAQVALTLRLVGGLSTDEIAAAFLVPEVTLAQRIVRAKRKIRDAAIPLSIPENLGERLEAALGVLYLVFNEGYLSRGETHGTRLDLMEESIRLTIRLAALVPGEPEVEGLLALQLYHRARTAARFAGDDLVLLEDQDRASWDRELIAQADSVLDAARRRGRPGPFQLQAAIARHHAAAETAADTDWVAIAALYGRLATVTRSPVVELNRAVAVAMADGAPAGLRVLDGIDGLGGYHLYWAARGELLLRAGRRDHARDALRRARELVRNPAERRHLDRRIAALE